MRQFWDMLEKPRAWVAEVGKATLLAQMGSSMDDTPFLPRGEVSIHDLRHFLFVKLGEIVQRDAVRFFFFFFEFLISSN